MSASSARLSRGQLVKAMVLAGVAGLIALLLESAATLIKGWKLPYGWALTALLAVIGGVVSLLISLATERALTAPPTDEGPTAPGTGYRPTTPSVRHRRTVPTVAGLLVLVLLCGAGGAAIAAGVQRVVTIIRIRIDPVSEQGVDRLVKPVTRESGPLTVTVHRVEVTPRITKVQVTARNEGNGTILLPGSFSQFAAPGSATLANRPLDSDLPNEVAAGGEISGLLVFDGVPPPGRVTATLTFPHVGGPGAPTSITVSGLRLSEQARVTDR
jgi:hypothetical protein